MLKTKYIIAHLFMLFGLVLLMGCKSNDDDNVGKKITMNDIIQNKDYEKPIAAYYDDNNINYYVFCLGKIENVLCERLMAPYYHDGSNFDYKYEKVAISETTFESSIEKTHTECVTSKIEGAISAKGTIYEPGTKLSLSASFGSEVLASTTDVVKETISKKVTNFNKEAISINYKLDKNTKKGYYHLILTTDITVYEIVTKTTDDKIYFANYSIPGMINTSFVFTGESEKLTYNKIKKLDSVNTKNIDYNQSKNKIRISEKTFSIDKKMVRNDSSEDEGFDISDLDFNKYIDKGYNYLKIFYSFSVKGDNYFIFNPKAYFIISFLFDNDVIYKSKEISIKSDSTKTITEYAIIELNKLNNYQRFKVRINNKFKSYVSITIKNFKADFVMFIDLN